MIWAGAEIWNVMLIKQIDMGGSIETLSISPHNHKISLREKSVSCCRF